MSIRTTIRETAGLWTVVVTEGDNVWSRHARTRERAEEVARDLEKLALSFKREA